MSPLLVRAVPGLPSNAAAEVLPDNAASEGRAAPDGAQWVHEVDTRPAQGVTLLTTAWTTSTGPAFRSIRVDIAAGGFGTITVTLLPIGGGAGVSTVLNVAASEVLPLSSAAMSAITSIGAGVVLHALG